MATGGVKVKTVLLRIVGDDADAEAKIAAITAKAEALSRLHPELTPRIDVAAASAKMAVLRRMLADEGHLAGQDAGDAAGQGFWAGLRSRLSTLSGTLTGGLTGGLLSRLLGGAGGAGGGLLASLGLGGAGPAAGAAGGIGTGGWIAIAAGSVAGLLTGLQGLIPALAAAGMGIASLGLLAYPTFSAITTAYGAVTTATTAYQQASLNLDQAIRRSPADMAAYRASLTGIEPHLRAAAGLLTSQKVTWQALSPSMQANVVALANNKAALKNLLPDQKKALDALMAQKTAWDQLATHAGSSVATGLQKLSASFQGLVAKFAPDVFKIFNDGLAIANKLLPDLLPFAQAAAGAIDQLLKGFGKFASSPGFKTWLGQMVQLTGPTITTFGTGIGQLVVALGKLMIALANPNALRMLKYTFDVLAVTITGLAIVFTRATGDTIRFFHGIAAGFDYVRHALAIFAHNWAHDFDTVRHAAAVLGHDMAIFFHDIADAFDQFRHGVATWGHDIAVAFDKVRHWFAQLPADILKFTYGFPRLLWNAGVHLIEGLWNGIASKVGGLLSYVGNLGSSILHSLGSALGIGSPSRITFQHGVWLAQGLAAGMDSGRSAVAAAAARMAGAASMGTGGAHAAGGGGLVVEVHVPPGGGMLGPEFWTQLAAGIRVRGGDPGMLQRKVRFA